MDTAQEEEVWQVCYVANRTVQERQPFKIHYISHNLVDDVHVMAGTQATMMKTNTTTRIGGQMAMRLVTTETMATEALGTMTMAMAMMMILRMMIPMDAGAITYNTKWLPLVLFLLFLSTFLSQ